MNLGTITVSVVSHGHGSMVDALVDRLRGFPQVTRIVLTLNIPEDTGVREDARVQLVRNAHPQGFGANHNAAFRRCDTTHYCVLNPDITLHDDVFPSLLECMAGTGAGMVAPLVYSPDGALEDSIRKFPSLHSLVLKAAGRDDGAYPAVERAAVFRPDWIAGMFMLFSRQAFERVGGFDEGFFLYYEDVDICARLWRSGFEVAACTGARVVHEAQRASRSDLRHMRWHAASMLRYFAKHMGRLPRRD